MGRKIQTRQAMKHQYRPHREMHSHKSAADIQRDIDLMRAMYDRREPLNHRRRDKETAAVHVFSAVAMVVPLVAVIYILAN
jgi:hypothetical protein